MSHLSRIKTQITNSIVLEKTLDDLGFTHKYINPKSPNIVVKDKWMNKFQLNWDGQQYLLIADLELWQDNIQIETLINKIIQQYSYNSIIETSIQEGFSHISKDFLQDGSIKLVIQKWI